MRKPSFALIVLLLVVAPSVARGEEKVPAPSTGQLMLGGEAVPFTAGVTVMKDDKGKPKAEIFSVAYRKKTTGGEARPVTFAFNGGPGSSSVWLHMGALGPYRTVMEPEGFSPKPPYRYAENAESWIGFTDIVFIDPVATGFSRPAKGENPKQFFGLHEDANSVADFIRQWLTTNDRWLSPVYLVGESYGTTRAAQLSVELAGRGIDVTGIVLVSPVLNFQTTDPRPGNDLGYWLYLPSMAATARYHGKVTSEKPLRAWLNEVEAFAETDYLLGLAKGTRLTGEARVKLAERLAAYTGLRTDYVLMSDLRVRPTEFRKELLSRDDGVSVGRLDSRFRGPDRVPAGSHPDRDPSMDAVRGPFTATVNHYLRRVLHFHCERVYQVMGNVHPWKMGRSENRYANVAESLGRAMRANPDLRVLCALGYYDLATPYYAVEYTMEHLGWPRTVAANVSYAYYESGHMMYLRDADRAKLRDDAANFYGRELEKK
jgi:carboxypeptidase C (cathepsin A)